MAANEPPSTFFNITSLTMGAMQRRRETEDSIRLPLVYASKRKALDLAEGLKDIPEAQDDVLRVLRCALDVTLGVRADGSYMILRGVFCKRRLLCRICASMWKAKYVRRYVPHFICLLKKQRSLKAAHVTFTLKDGDDLAERVAHLRCSFRRLLQRRRDAVTRGRSCTQWGKTAGGVGCVHVKIGEGSGLWHAHFHAIVLLTDDIDLDVLREEWRKITGDSEEIHLRQIRVRRPLRAQQVEDELRKALAYATDLEELAPLQAWEAHMSLWKVRLLCSWGDVRCVKVPKRDEQVKRLGRYRYNGGGYSPKAQYERDRRRLEEED